MAQELQRVAGVAAEAARRRGRKAPIVPEAESLPDDTERGVSLFNSVVLDKLLRESAARTG